MRYTLALPVTALALVALASTARAQSGAAPAPAASAPGVAVAPAMSWTAKSVGTYDFTVQGTGNDEDVAKLIIATDSTGALTAKVVEGPRNDEHPLTVEVRGDDLVMRSQTNNGVLMFTVQRHGNDIAGRWEIGSQQGTITGKLHS